MIGRQLGQFDMYVGYLTERYTVTKPSIRPISIWRGSRLIAELDPVEVDKARPWVRYADLWYSAEMSVEWKNHFTKRVVCIWRDHVADIAEQEQEVTS